VRRGRFHGLKSNLAVLHDLPQDSPNLEERVIENLSDAFVCYVDLFIITIRGPAAIEAAFELDPAGLHLIENHLAEGRGVVVVAAHWSSIDIFMLAMSRRFPGAQVLTLIKQPLGTRIINWLKGKYGLKLTPITSASLRTAIRRLRAGGIVAVAADVPTPYGAKISLFGRPCQLPIGHTRLAAATNSAMVVGVSWRVGAGKYRGIGIEVPSNGGDEVVWAASALEVLERHILARPGEWFGQPQLWP
jgi:lauroyl/myristoyl acyltransferase